MGRAVGVAMRPGGRDDAAVQLRRIAAGASLPEPGSGSRRPPRRGSGDRIKRRGCRKMRGDRSAEEKIDGLRKNNDTAHALSLSDATRTSVL